MSKSFYRFTKRIYSLPHNSTNSEPFSKLNQMYHGHSSVDIKKPTTANIDTYVFPTTESTGCLMNTYSINEDFFNSAHHNQGSYTAFVP